ncbi:MAG: tRNA (N(6)-L-threonylcarbamoyladenosine(37)-C(2))-methylthiotransferase [Candidatus Woesearchaeota archaeon]
MDTDINTKTDPNNTIVYIKTFGCAINQSDSEVMAGLLEDEGYEVINVYTEDQLKTTNLSDNLSNNLSDDLDNNEKLSINDKINDKIDVVIINTCTVKNLAESKFFKELRKWKKYGVKIIVAGCIPQAEKELLNTKLSDVSVIGVKQISEIVSVVNDVLKGDIVHKIDYTSNERLNLPKIRRNGIIEILPISEGCIGSCSYCKTKFARGNLLSYPKEKIISQFKNALNDGCYEFWITSQDNGCYGFDIYRKEKYYLPQLLNDLLSIPGNFRIRLGMSNPNHVMLIKDDLIKTFNHPKMFKFLHIPIQSANNRILKIMNRHYTREDFIDIIDSFRKKIPDITISTDIIVGFPTESEEEFIDSINLVKQINFSVLNLSRFWLRKGTNAENMIQLRGDIIKDRLIRIKKIFDTNSEKRNKFFLGTKFDVVIDEINKNGQFIGRDDYYRQVVIKNSSKRSVLGSVVKVNIIDITKYLFIGEIIQ